MRTIGRLVGFVALLGCGESPADAPPETATDGGTPASDATVDPPSVSYLAPVLAGRTPARGDDNVSVRAPIIATFENRVRLEGTGATLVAAGSALLASSSSLSTDKKSVTIVPATGLVAPITITATLGGVTNEAGNPFVDPGTWTWTAPLWLRVGPSMHVTDAAINELSIAATAAGDVVVASDRSKAASSTQTIDVRSMQKGAWTTLGAFGAGSTTPSVHVGVSGNLLVAFRDGETVRVKTWEGAAWSDVGAALGTSHAYRAPSIASTKDVTFVAYEEALGASSSQVVVRSFGATGSWQAVGGAVSDGIGNTHNPAIALDGAGVPYVTYTDSGALRVRKWTGSAWTSVGTAPMFPGELCESAAIAIDDTNAPIVFAYYDDASHYDYRAFRYSGPGWIQLGAALDQTSRGPSLPVSIANGARGYVATWTSCLAGCHLRVAEFAADSGVWQPIDSPSGTDVVQRHAFALDANGLPVVAWASLVTATPLAQDIVVRTLNR